MKHCFTRFLGILTAIAAISAFSSEASATGKAVVVISKDGSRHEVELQKLNRIDIGLSSVTVHDRDGQSREHVMSEIDRILIGADAAGIADVVSGGDVAVWPTVTEGLVNVAGLEPGTVVKVCDVNGSVVAGTTASSEDVTLDLSAQASGIYVVAFDNHSVKIVKK